MSIEYVKPERSNKLIFNEFVYLNDRESQGTTSCRCENRGSCSSRNHLYCDTAVKDTNSYNQAPDGTRIEIRKALTKSTKRDKPTMTSNMMPQCIIGSVSLQLQTPLHNIWHSGFISCFDVLLSYFHGRHVTIVSLYFFPKLHPSRFMRGYYYTIADVFVTKLTAKYVKSTLPCDKKCFDSILTLQRSI